MKLITLNIWGGHVHQPLLSFFKAHQNVEIFCLQEVYYKAEKKVSSEDRVVYLDIFSEIQSLLPSHNGYFMPVVNNIYGLAIFIKKSIKVLQESDFQIYDNPNYPGLGPAHSRSLQQLDCQIGNHFFSVINVHGLWNGQGKGDSPERIEQSKCIKKQLDNVAYPKILCGDFNLRPDTESLNLIENDLRNLIVENGVTSTRTSYYEKTERFADYIFTSTEIIVNSFSVLNDEVSDHSPLLLDFAINV